MKSVLDYLNADVARMSTWKLSFLLLPRAHAQRGKVIGLVVVVVSSKIARSGILGEFASDNCSYMVSEIERKRAYGRQSCP